MKIEKGSNYKTRYFWGVELNTGKSFTQHTPGWDSMTMQEAFDMPDVAKFFFYDLEGKLPTIRIAAVLGRRIIKQREINPEYHCGIGGGSIGGCVEPVLVEVLGYEENGKQVLTKIYRDKSVESVVRCLS